MECARANASRRRRRRRREGWTSTSARTDDRPSGDFVARGARPADVSSFRQRRVVIGSRVASSRHVVRGNRSALPGVFIRGSLQVNQSSMDEGLLLLLPAGSGARRPPCERAALRRHNSHHMYPSWARNPPARSIDEVRTPFLSRYLTALIRQARARTGRKHRRSSCLVFSLRAVFALEHATRRGTSIGEFQARSWG